MVRIPKIRDWLLDEAEGFLLEHALISPPRTWPPLPATQAERIAVGRKKMDWEGEVRDNPDDPLTLHPARDDDGGDEENKERCVICLMALRDRTIVGVCGHEFCFECIGVWANQSRKCPLCSAEMAPFLLHDLDSSVPTKFYLPPLPQFKLPSASQAGPSRHTIGRWQKHRQDMDELDYQVERRIEIYKNELFVKHIGSNPITKFVPNPTPRQISEDPALIQRATQFLRRELRVWSLVDVEVLTGHILVLIKAIDIRSEPAVRLLGELLDTDEYPRGAEQFAHELYSWLRSPFKDLRRYDEIAQYDKVPDPNNRSPSRSKSRSRSRSRSISPPHRSPSPLSSGSRSVSSISSTSSPRRSRSHSRGQSYRSRSRSRSRLHQRPRSRSRSNSRPRRWDEPDTWLDPEYEAYLRAKEKSHQERMEIRRRMAQERDHHNHQEQKPMRSWGQNHNHNQNRTELLPSPPPAVLRMDEDEEDHVAETTALTIKGAARDTSETKRLTLLERLAKAKAEGAVKPISMTTEVVDTENINPDVDMKVIKGRGIRARIQLKLKLESEKKQFRDSINESKAQALRHLLLESKARREAAETDITLKRLDMIDRQREVRRRLMVLKMMAAETDQERRARELREKLLARKKAIAGPAIAATGK